MELNLRKARKLESKIDSLVKKLNNQVKTSKSVRVNADIQTEVLPELVEARNEFSQNYENIISLVDAKYSIRQLIGDKNQESGINSKINEKVKLENRLSIINNVLNSFDYLDQRELEDDSARYKALLENGDRFSRSTFEANFLLQKDEDNYKNEKINLNKQVEKIEDELLDLNASTKIKLSKDLVSLLQLNNLL